MKRASRFFSWKSDFRKEVKEESKLKIFARDKTIALLRFLTDKKGHFLSEIYFDFLMYMGLFIGFLLE